MNKQCYEIHKNILEYVLNGGNPECEVLAFIICTHKEIKSIIFLSKLRYEIEKAVSRGSAWIEIKDEWYYTMVGEADLTDIIEELM